MKDEKTDDSPYFVTCTYCGTQTQLSLTQFESDRPLKCPTCGAPFKVVPPPKKPPVKKRKKPFDDYDTILMERQSYERRTENEKGKAVALAAIILGATILIVLFLLGKC